MKILVGKCFGLGNACLAVPMVRALATLGEVDVLVGSTPDDVGAYDVFYELRQAGTIGNLWVDQAPWSITYDVAVMAIPFDGRWKNGEHYHARRVMDERKRPGNVERLGFDMWEKHEAAYMLENAHQLGYYEGYGIQETDCSFIREKRTINKNLIYLGIGFKRDPGGFGRSKNWGLDNFIEFIRNVCRSTAPTTRFVSTGNMADFMEIGRNIMKEVRPGDFEFKQLSLSKSFEVISECAAYFGNDTGMAHVAASLGMPTYVMTPYPDLQRKNPPLSPISEMRLFGPSAKEIAVDFIDFVYSARE